MLKRCTSDLWCDEVINNNNKALNFPYDCVQTGFKNLYLSLRLCELHRQIKGLEYNDL